MTHYTETPEVYPGQHAAIAARIGTHSRIQRLVRLATLRGDRLALATLAHDRRYVPDPADHYIFSAPIARYRRWTEAELRESFGG